MFEFSSVDALPWPLLLTGIFPIVFYAVYTHRQRNRLHKNWKFEFVAGIILILVGAIEYSMVLFLSGTIMIIEWSIESGGIWVIYDIPSLLMLLAFVITGLTLIRMGRTARLHSLTPAARLLPETN